MRCEDCCLHWRNIDYGARVIQQVSYQLCKKVILRQIYFWTTDFKGLSTVATVIISNKTCQHQDSFQSKNNVVCRGRKLHPKICCKTALCNLHKLTWRETLAVNTALEGSSRSCAGKLHCGSVPIHSHSIIDQMHSAYIGICCMCWKSIYNGIPLWVFVELL